MPKEKIKFGWDYWDYSHQSEVRDKIIKNFGGLTPDYTWQNDSDTLPLDDMKHQVTNAWHNVYPIFYNHKQNEYAVEDKDTKDYVNSNESFMYVISTNGGPAVWCGEFDKRSTLFYNIKEHTKEHIRKGKVLVVVDLSFEGFAIDGLDSYSQKEMGPNPHLVETAHRRAKEENFPIENIVFLSGNHKDPEYYDWWCKENKIEKRLNWILLDWCEKAISSDFSDVGETFESHLKYKSDNFEDMKTYLCLMRRWKLSRVYHHLALNHYDLLEDGLVSAVLSKWDLYNLFPDIDRTSLEMNNANEITNSDCAGEDDLQFNKDLVNRDDLLDIIVQEYKGKLKPDVIGLGLSRDTFKIRSSQNIKSFFRKLPMVVDTHRFDVLDSFHDWDIDFYKKTFFSFVYETWALSPNMVFYSEKIYKCILNFHPFISWANCDTMKYLRKNDYKTFSPFIDESYDEVKNNSIRSEYLMKEMVRICSMDKKELLKWYESQGDILIHNYNNFMSDIRFEKSISDLLQVYRRVINGL